MNELFFSYKLKELKSHSLHNGQKANIGKKGKSLQYIDHKAPLIVSKFLKAIGKGKEYPAKKKETQLKGEAILNWKTKTLSATIVINDNACVAGDLRE